MSGSIPMRPIGDPVTSSASSRRSGVACLVLGLVAIVAVGACGSTATASHPGNTGPTGVPTSSASAVATLAGPGTTASDRIPSSSESLTPKTSATAAPKTTPVPLGALCHSDKFGLTVSYLLAWHEYTADSALTCTLFDPKPFPVITDGSDPRGLIEIVSFADPSAAEVTQFEKSGKLVSKVATNVDGRTATVLEIDDTGTGVAPNGMHDYLYLIDIGAGTLAIGTSGISDPALATADWPYQGYQVNVKIVDAMANALKFDPAS